MSSPTSRPPPLPGLETYQEKATRKFKENPWVPLGSLATVGALLVAMVKMRRGQSQSFNHWLRARVAAQGLTIVALVAGTYSMRPKVDAPSDDPTLTRNDTDVERRRLEKIAKEKDEFEERMKDAQYSHDVESAFKEGMKKRREEAANAKQATESSTSGSLSGWFGGSSDKTSSDSSSKGSSKSS